MNNTIKPDFKWNKYCCADAKRQGFKCPAKNCCDWHTRAYWKKVRSHGSCCLME